ncbi:MAG: sigma-70 family RNA polymerase sigma factor [Oscillospiraceae bacterium]|nr:sigma-70 family RNA polymerase sigma factor [Oscillospiraceae bacterium]
MDYRVFAAEELRTYKQKCMSAQVMKDRIEELEGKLSSIGGAGGSVPSFGGGNKTEQKWLNLIASIDDEKRRLRESVRATKRVDRALSILPEEEAKFLKSFYIEGYTAEELTEIAHLSLRQVYRAKKTALTNFTRAYFGVVVT